MKPKWLTLMLFILCLWPIAIHLALPQAKPIPSNMCSEVVDIPTPKDPAIVNKEFDNMCFEAASFGYEAVGKGLTEEQMLQELKEILYENYHNR